MCQPSASSAIELNQEPAAISTTMVMAVRPTTIQVRRSCLSCWLPRKLCVSNQDSSLSPRMMPPFAASSYRM